MAFMRIVVAAMAGLLLFTTTTHLYAQEAAFQNLVEDSSLEHWLVSSGNAGRWRAIDGMIDYDGKSAERNRLDKDLYTRQWYRNFIFIFEWRFPGPPVEGRHRITLPDGGFAMNPDGSYQYETKMSAGDSGIYLRGWEKLQVNLWCHAMGSGQLYGFQHDMSLPVEKRRACVPKKNNDRTPGEWNTMSITLIDNTISIEQNGEIIIDPVELAGLPYGGPIGLQHHGDHVQFRNMRIQEMPPVTHGFQRLEEQLEQAPGAWTDLLAGKTVNDFDVFWAGGASWTLLDGILRGEDPTAISWIFLKESYADFILSLEYRLSPGGNGGVSFRLPWPDDPERKTGPAFLGYECQLNGSDAINPTGSLYMTARAYATDDQGRPIHREGEWNTCRIYARGDHLATTINNRRCAETHDARSLNGRIGFQAHEPSHWVEYRNVRIKVLE